MQQRNEPWAYQPWMKFYTRNWIMGSIRTDCTPEERSIFTDLMAMANESRDRGVIQANPTTPYQHSRLAEILNVTEELLERSLQKFTTQGRIHENSVGITITNFKFYNPPAVHTGVRGRPSKIPKEQLPLEVFPNFTGKPSQKALKTWQGVLKELEREVSKGNYSTWFQKTLGLSYKDGKFVVGVPNSHTASHLSQNQLSLIERILAGVTKEQLDIEFEIYDKD